MVLDILKESFKSVEFCLELWNPCARVNNIAYCSVIYFVAVQIFFFTFTDSLMQAMFAVIDDIDALFNDVGEVQKELETFGAERIVDANEIYELLETHYLRSDRVQFVTTHLLVSLGLRNNCEEGDVINVPDESDDDYLEDLNCTSSMEYIALNDPDVLDLSTSDFGCAAESHMHCVTREMDNGTGHPEALAACQVDMCLSESVSQNRRKNSSQVHGTEPTASLSSLSSSVAADALKNESYVVVKAAVQSSHTNLNLEPNNSHAVSIPNNQNDNFMCDVNNNDPNNNTEYQVPVQTEDKQEQLDSPAREVDESGEEFEDQDDIRCKLLEEALLIHHTVPRQNLEQIYSYLEANLDHKNRVQIVMQEFLRMEWAPELCASAVSDNSSVGNKSDVTWDHSKNVSETHVLSNPQSCTSVEETDTIKKNDFETNIHPEPQPSTSKINRKAFTSYDMYPFRSKNSKLKEMGSPFNEKCGMEVEQGKVSKSCLSVGKPFSKECNTSHVPESILDSVISTVPSATYTKQPDVLEVSSTSTSNVSAESDYRITNNISEIDITSAANYNVQTQPIISDDFALETDTSESSRPGWKDAKPDVYAAGETVIPLSTTESVELIACPLTRKRRKSKGESLDEESSPVKIGRQKNTNQRNLLPQRKVAAEEIMLTQNQQKYKSLLMEMFPDADPQYLKQQCQTLQTEESFFNVVTELLENANYPHRQTLKEAHVESLAGPSISEEDRVEMQFDTLAAILPNADPAYLWETCEKIGSDENAMKSFVAHALETKKYPTREDYLKRQEALTLQKKYTEQFSIESFLEIIPDPFKYFLEDKRNPVETEHAISYLKRRYRRIRCTDLRSTFCHNHRNLTLTCQELDSFKGVLRRCKRSEYECGLPAGVNIPFLQEVSSAVT